MSRRLLGRTALAAAVAITSIAAYAAPVASADHHLVKIREFSIGANGTAGLDAFIELQMYEAGQNAMSGHTIQGFNTNASSSPTFSMVGTNPTNSQSQRTVLLTDVGGGGDLTLTGIEAFLETNAAGGALCFLTTIDPTNTTDCVSWGGFSAFGSLPSPAASPIAGGLVANMAYRRSITGGSCATALDAGDDTNNSTADFATVTPPGPTPNSATPAETLCTGGGGGGSTTPPGNPTAPINPAGNVRVRKCKKSNRSSGAAHAAKKKKCKKKR